MTAGYSYIVKLSGTPLDTNQTYSFTIPVDMSYGHLLLCFVLRL